MKEDKDYQNYGEPAAKVVVWHKGTSAEYSEIEFLGNDLDDGTKLYTHTDTAEVERLHEEVSAYKESRERLHEWLREERLKNIALRGQLSERDGHLENALDVLKNVDDLDWTGQGVKSDIERALSASAEPSATDCATCDGDKLMVIGFNSDAGENIEGPCPACCKPSAPVEIDERADFENWGKTLFYVACFERDDADSYVGRGLQGAWLGWQARAALDRKL